MGKRRKTRVGVSIFSYRIAYHRVILCTYVFPFLSHSETVYVVSFIVQQHVENYQGKSFT